MVILYCTSEKSLYSTEAEHVAQAFNPTHTPERYKCCDRLNCSPARNRLPLRAYCHIPGA